MGVSIRVGSGLASPCREGDPPCFLIQKSPRGIQIQNFPGTGVPQFGQKLPIYVFSAYGARSCKPEATPQVFWMPDISAESALLRIIESHLQRWPGDTIEQLGLAPGWFVR